MTRTLISETTDLVGRTVTVCGWVNRVRDHKKVLFIDLRDRTGLLQIVTGTFAPESYDVMKRAGPEWVIEITGMVAARPEKLVNAELATGTVELQAVSCRILAEAETPLFEVNGDTAAVEEEARLANRYLDLRTARMSRILRGRAAAASWLRTKLDHEGFIEVETPLLSATTPEGARDFVVPTRRRGEFYALPQSPQQYKQLLMAGGIEAYYQFARCLRDEDGRGDRQPEFTQLDMELSFVERKDVMAVNERLLTGLIAEKYPHLRIQTLPFPRMTYAESMSAYGSDRPDLRQDPADPTALAFCWITDFPFYERSDDGGWTFTHNPFSAPLPEWAEDLRAGTRTDKVLSSQYDLALNGYEILGGSIRSHAASDVAAVFRTLGYPEEELERSFGHLLRAFRSGTPPHGGCAWGFDRLMMILEGQPNIREVIAFPKTGEGRDPLMGGPAGLPDGALAELHLQLRHGR